MAEPAAWKGYRRVVTGLDADGRSCVVLDGPIPRLAPINAAFAWRTEGHPADNTGTQDTAVPYTIERLHTGGSNFAICEFPAGTDAVLHATDTIDYLVVLTGTVTLVLETGEVALKPHDFVVDRGVIHGWRNPSDVPCVAAVVNLPAHPVGAGRTV